MRGKIVIFVALFLCAAAAPSFAGWDAKPELRWMQKFSYDDRRENHTLYINRVSATFVYLSAEKKELFKLIPFFEARRNVDKNLWEREELGAEIGKDIFSWFYVGGSFYEGWMNEDYWNHGDYVRRGYQEFKGRLCLSHELMPENRFKPKAYVLEEYSYDCRDGRGIRNEVTIGVTALLAQHIEVGAGWHHIDRIPQYDSDCLEGSVTLVF